MNITAINLDWIFGFALGFSITPVGDADEDEGYLIIEIGILRFIIVYE